MNYVPTGSAPYELILGLLLFSRGMDFLSTWLATPRLVLEANPIARKLGWKLGIALNVLLCFGFAFWPLPSLVIVTTSVLVAARNFQSAWLMHTLGEEKYRSWVAARLAESHLGVYLFCLFAQTFLIGGLGAGLIAFSHRTLVPFAVGLGLITYALAVTLYTLISMWRIRRAWVERA